MKILLGLLQHLNPRNKWDDVRRNTKQYQAKRKLVSKIWFTSSIFIFVSLLIFPVAAIILLLQTTFLSFVILDETEEDEIDPNSNFKA